MYWVKSSYFSGSLFEDLREGALKHKGKAFSLHYDVPTETTTYKRGFLSLWCKAEQVFHNDYSRFEQDVAGLRSDGYNDISFIISPVVFRDERNPKICSSREPKLYEGYSIAVTVDEHSSQKLYTACINIAEQFQDYLLSCRSSLIFSLCNEIIRKHRNRTSVVFYIGIDGLYEESNKGYSSTAVTNVISFAEMQLKPLESIAHCYGLGLALAEALKNKLAQNETLHCTVYPPQTKRTIVYENKDMNSVEINVQITKKKNEFHEW